MAFPEREKVAPRVFISYSHDSPEHEAQVRALADHLREDGVDAVIDQYDTRPQAGWPMWMNREIQDADFIALVCTENYLKRVEGRESTGKGRGVLWEAKLIYNLIYGEDTSFQKFIPLLLEDGTQSSIPLPIRGLTRYYVQTDQGYEDFYRHITNQPRYERPMLGKLKPLPTIPPQSNREISPLPSQNVSRNSIVETVDGATAATERDILPADRRKLAIIAACLLILAATGYYIWAGMHPVHALTDRDTLLLADFTNNTGEPVFDNTLREGLAIDFEQSPFLQMVSDRKIQETLRLMNRPPDQRITGENAHQVCVRTGARAMVTGTISKLGSHYPIQLKAVICESEKVLAATEAEAGSREQTLQALHQAGSDLRSKLGESREILKKYDKTLEEVTTSSLDALYAYSNAYRIQARSSEFAAVPLMKRALDIDPDFARAHVELGSMYMSMGQSTAAREHFRKAFELHERVSTREQYSIKAAYYEAVTGELDKAREQYELWLHEYPRETEALDNYAGLLVDVGQNEKALATLRSVPDGDRDLVTYYYLLLECRILGRFEEAKEVLQAARGKDLDDPPLGTEAYLLAFTTNDQTGMKQELSRHADQLEFKEALLEVEFQTQAYFGSLQKARSLATQAAQIRRRLGNKENAARILARMGLLEALLDNPAAAVGSANHALNESHGRGVLVVATLTLALARQTAQARSLANDLSRDFAIQPVQNYSLPCILAALQIGQKQSGKALQILERIRGYEMRWTGYELEPLSPLYLRGQALLLAGDSTAAAAEFQRILEQPGLMANSYLGPLAKLGLARAEALEISKAKDSVAAQAAKTRARTAYQEFLTLWKDADPEIPILKQAKAEYAKLQ
jgi:eukaryotic-like serine/threonine-protein kinase